MQKEKRTFIFKLVIKVLDKLKFCQIEKIVYINVNNFYQNFCNFYKYHYFLSYKQN